MSDLIGHHDGVYRENAGDCVVEVYRAGRGWHWMVWDRVPEERARCLAHNTTPCETMDAAELAALQAVADEPWR